MSATSSALQKLLDQRKQATTSYQKTIKPEPGRSRYRILPSWRKPDAAGVADPTFYHDFGQHFVKDAAGTLKAVYICTEKTYGRPCDHCSMLAEAIVATQNNGGDDVAVKRLKDATSKARVLINVLHIDGKTPTIPQIMEIAPSVFDGKSSKGGGAKVGGIISLFSEWPDLLDPIKGNDIIIERSGNGLDTQYSVQVAGASQPVPAEALAKLNDLDKFVAQESADRARKALLAVSAITGALPSPAMMAAIGIEAAPSADTPSAETQAALAAAVAASAAIAAAAAAPAGVAPVVAAPVAAAPVVAAPVAPVAPVVAAPAPVVAAAAVSTGDAEVDALLKDLEGLVV
jgi:hypothetical protein